MEPICQLAALISDLNEYDGSYATAISGLYLTKHRTITVPRNTVEHPVLCIVAQGAKCALLHDERYSPHLI